MSPPPTERQIRNQYTKVVEQRATESTRDIIVERGDVVLANRDVDDNLGYDPRFRPFVREWLEFGNKNSPDLLDATYYALQKLDLSRDADSAGYAGDMYNRR